MRCVLLLSVCAGLPMVPAAYGQTPGEQAQFIFESSLLDLQMIRTVQFEMEVDAPGVPGRGPLRVRLLAAGDRYRYESYDVPYGTGEQAVDEIKVFDGHRYQVMTSVEKTLAVTRFADVRNVARWPYRTVLTAPFWWLFEPGESMVWQATKNPRRWEHLLPMVRAVRHEDTPRGPAVVVECENSRGFQWEVHFLPDAAYLPIRSSEIDEAGNVLHSCEVQEWKECLIDDQSVVVPTSVVRWDGPVGGGTIRRTYRVVDGTLQVNTPIAATEFTIAPEAAVAVYDLDAGTLTTRGSETLVHLDQHGIPVLPPPADLKGQDGVSDGVALRLFLINVVVLCCVLVARVILKRTRA